MLSRRYLQVFTEVCEQFNVSLTRQDVCVGVHVDVALVSYGPEEVVVPRVGYLPST